MDPNPLYISTGAGGPTASVPTTIPGGTTITVNAAGNGNNNGINGNGNTQNDGNIYIFTSAAAPRWRSASFVRLLFLSSCLLVFLG